MRPLLLSVLRCCSSFLIVYWHMQEYFCRSVPKSYPAWRSIKSDNFKDSPCCQTGANLYLLLKPIWLVSYWNLKLSILNERRVQFTLIQAHTISMGFRWQCFVGSHKTLISLKTGLPSSSTSSLSTTVSLPSSPVTFSLTFLGIFRRISST